jgi:ABC-type phosphate transport system permease subunit
MANMKKSAFSLSPLVAKVQSLVSSKQDDSPMFNQPLNTNSCPHHRLARQLYSASLVVLFITAILVITLKAMTYSFVEDNRMTGFIFDTETDSNTNRDIIMAALPQMLHILPTKLAIIIAAISLSVATAHLGLVIADWKSGKRVREKNSQYQKNT